MNKQLIIMAISVAFFAGCAGKAVQYESFNPNNSWQADGKLGVKYPRCDEYRGCKDEAVNASYVWTHDSSTDRLQLFDPTGQEQLALRYVGDQVEIHEDGKIERISVDKLADRLGMELPIFLLDEWLTTERPETEWDSNGWHIRVNDWQGHFYRKMTLTQDDYRLRLVTFDVKPM